MLKDPQKLKDQQKKRHDLVATLDKPGGSDNAARLALSMIEATQSPAPN